MQNLPQKFKIIAVVGPTASGKSELAVQLAKKYNGEVISCDSRQVYKGMDIGTGKVEGTSSKKKTLKVDGRTLLESQFVYKSIPHHCIDFVDPKKQFSVSEFQACANKAIGQITARGNLPILCGGTGLWVDSVVFNKKIPEVKPNLKLREELEKLSNDELYQKLKLLDPDRAAVIDFHNPRRLIRALEIIITTGKPVPKQTAQDSQLANSTLWIGIYPGQEELYKNIDVRLSERIEIGMIDEVSKLHYEGLSWKKLEAFGLEYKYISFFLQKKISKIEMIQQLSFAIKHYAKRQMTWFRKNESICWAQNSRQALALAQELM